ncbi:urease accessory protein UreD [Actinokineospora bangkokensis]|uniref:Urease accessory protein UreD n=1 Tax=Actinokineospora bangkokensis TaxID=1193682 RepID=A0A1Q9LKL4_9PSEU|nr:urease accessory protein UreD [Actinokineospora bangkokensis]OLR92543.1 hypothetical protein BJP25_21005 [Actinokineospora bangkokensis]
MRARARLVVERVGDRAVVRELVSVSPMTLLPQRGTGPVAVVHLVNSAAAPLGGDDLGLDVLVGPGAQLRLVGVAATVALPGTGRSTARTTLSVADGGECEYLPEPTVVTRHADHHAVLRVALAGSGRVRLREVLVLGRKGEAPGHLTTETHVTRDGRPVLRQSLVIGDPVADQALAGLAGHRVLATEVGAGHAAPPVRSGEWHSLVPLEGGYLATALADDAVTAAARLAEALTGLDQPAAAAP